MTSDRNQSAPEITYPCQWLYKVIGQGDFEKIRQAITETINDPGMVITASNASSTGKYTSLNMEMPVRDEDDRNEIYTALKAHPDIIMVL